MKNLSLSELTTYMLVALVRKPLYNKCICTLAVKNRLIGLLLSFLVHCCKYIDYLHYISPYAEQNVEAMWKC